MRTTAQYHHQQSSEQPFFIPLSSPSLATPPITSSTFSSNNTTTAASSYASEGKMPSSASSSLRPYHPYGAQPASSASNGRTDSVASSFSRHPHATATAAVGGGEVHGRYSVASRASSSSVAVMSLQPTTARWGGAGDSACTVAGRLSLSYARYPSTSPSVPNANDAPEDSSSFFVGASRGGCATNGLTDHPRRHPLMHVEQCRSVSARSSNLSPEPTPAAPAPPPPRHAAAGHHVDPLEALLANMSSSMAKGGGGTAAKGRGGSDATIHSNPLPPPQQQHGFGAEEDGERRQLGDYSPNHLAAARARYHRGGDEGADGGAEESLPMAASSFQPLPWGPAAARHGGDGGRGGGAHSGTGLPPAGAFSAARGVWGTALSTSHQHASPARRDGGGAPRGGGSSSTPSSSSFASLFPTSVSVRQSEEALQLRVASQSRARMGAEMAQRDGLSTPNRSTTTTTTTTRVSSSSFCGGGARQQRAVSPPSASVVSRSASPAATPPTAAGRAAVAGRATTPKQQRGSSSGAAATPRYLAHTASSSSTCSVRKAAGGNHTGGPSPSSSSAVTPARRGTNQSLLLNQSRTAAGAGRVGGATTPVSAVASGRRPLTARGGVHNSYGSSTSRATTPSQRATTPSRPQNLHTQAPLAPPATTPSVSAQPKSDGLGGRQTFATPAQADATTDGRRGGWACPICAIHVVGSERAANSDGQQLVVHGDAARPPLDALFAHVVSCLSARRAVEAFLARDGYTCSPSFMWAGGDGGANGSAISSASCIVGSSSSLAAHRSWGLAESTDTVERSVEDLHRRLIRATRSSRSGATGGGDSGGAAVAGASRSSSTSGGSLLAVVPNAVRLEMVREEYNAVALLFARTSCGLRCPMGLGGGGGCWALLPAGASLSTSAAQQQQQQQCVCDDGMVPLSHTGAALGGGGGHGGIGGASLNLLLPSSHCQQSQQGGADFPEQPLALEFLAGGGGGDDGAALKEKVAQLCAVERRRRLTLVAHRNQQQGLSLAAAANCYHGGSSSSAVPAPLVPLVGHALQCWRVRVLVLGAHGAGVAMGGDHHHYQYDAGASPPRPAPSPSQLLVVSVSFRELCEWVMTARGNSGGAMVPPMADLHGHHAHRGSHHHGPSDEAAVAHAMAYRDLASFVLMKAARYVNLGGGGGTPLLGDLYRPAANALAPSHAAAAAPPQYLEGSTRIPPSALLLRFFEPMLLMK